MAFQVPSASASSLTTDLWPSMKNTLAVPWRALGSRSESWSFGQRRAASTSTSASQRTTGRSSVKGPQSLSLPECLASAAIEALRPPSIPAPHANTSNTLVQLSSTRNVLHAANPYRQHVPLAVTRSASTLASAGMPLARPSKPAAPKYLPHRRTLFGLGSPSQTLLINMEQTANNNPNSASAQNAFYSALLRANMPRIVVERYQLGRFASNKTTEEVFQKALEQVARTEGGTPASAQGVAPRQFSPEQLKDIASTTAARAGGLTQGRYTNVAGGTGDKESPVHVLVDEPRRVTIYKWAKFLIGYGLLAYFALVLLTVLVETTGLLRKTASPNAEAQKQQKTVRFSDVHGVDEAKEELQELVEFLKNPERFAALGGKMPKGVLLVGPPGTGKTLLARAVAGEAGVPFFYMSGSEFDEMYVGVGAKRVRELFANARAKAPAIVFIDELDAIGAKRNEKDPTYVKQSLNQLLTELDGFTQDTGVIILGATNFPRLLDKALTRPGRFDRNVEVPLPDVRGRMKILQHYLKNVKVDSDIDPELLARGTSGFSGAELESLINQAAVHASKNRTPTVTMLDMEWAKDKILMGAERRSFVVPEKEKLMTAYHEAGHALVGIYTEGHTPVYKATIMPRGQALGVTHFLPEMDKIHETKSELLTRLDVSMGGKAAEEIVYGNDKVTGGCSSDISQATTVAYAMITRYGMSDNLGNMDFDSIYNSLSAETRHRIEAEVRSMIDAAHDRATNLLLSKRKELDILANALVEYEVLSLEEMRKVLRGEKLAKMKALKGGSIKLPELRMPPGIGTDTGTPPPGAAGGRGAGGGRIGGAVGGGGSETGTAVPSPPPPPPAPPAGSRSVKARSTADDEGIEAA